MELTTKYQGEKEILLPRDIKFKIIDIDYYENKMIKFILLAFPKNPKQFSNNSILSRCSQFNIGSYNLYSYITDDNMSGTSKKMSIKKFIGKFNKFTRKK